MRVVIIPVYQPDETLAVLVDQLWMQQYQIVVVDDGSGEKYRQIFDCIKDICVVLTHPVNRGKGAAVKTALRYIQKEMWDCKVIAVMDADGQHLAEDLAGLFARSEAHPYTLVLGVRAVGKEMPPKSRLGNKITRTVFWLASGVRVSDTQTGLRAFGVKLVPELLQVEGERYEYEMNVLMAFARRGIPIAEVPIYTIYRDKKNSSSHFRAFRDSVRIYRDIFRFTLSSLSGFVLDYLLFMIFTLIVPHTAGWILLANVAARFGSAFYNYVLNWDGTMDIYEPGQVDVDRLMERGAYRSWIFGPSLLDQNGKAKESFWTWDYITYSHPRTAIGYFEPGHYCLLLVDGRQYDFRRQSGIL